ncbi:MAG: arginase family protein, partial [Chitinophagaceae bacterium]
MRNNSQSFTIAPNYFYRVTQLIQVKSEDALLQQTPFYRDFSGYDLLSCRTQAYEYSLALMEDLDQAKLFPTDLVYFGLRDFEVEEKALIDELGIKYHTVEQVRAKGVEQCCQETLRYLKDCDYLYISFDVDSMDSSIVSEGTGTPVPKGFIPSEILSILKNLLASRKVICVEFCEINPLLDKQGNKMAET